MKDVSFDQLLNDFFRKEGLYEDKKQLDGLIDAIGYGSREEFFDDNPGALTAIVDWITDEGDRVQEWYEALRERLAGRYRVEVTRTTVEKVTLIVEALDEMDAVAKAEQMASDSHDEVVRDDAENQCAWEFDDEQFEASNPEVLDEAR